MERAGKDAAAKRVDDAIRHPRKCQGHRKNGEPCDRWAIKGGTVCPTHGGSAPQVKAKAVANVQRQEAEAAARRLSLPIEVDPADALLDELFRTAGWIATYEAYVNEQTLDEGSHWGPIYGGKDGYDTGERKPNIVVELLYRERQHLKDLTVAILKAGIEERRVRLAEEQATQLARVITAILTDLGHDLTDPRTREVVRLRLIEGGKAA